MTTDNQIPMTKEEVHALIEVQNKATEQMVTIATSLHVIMEEQKEILRKLSNGIKKEIVEGVKLETVICSERLLNEINVVHTMLNDRGRLLKRVDDNMTFTKWFVGIVGIAIIIATVVLRGLEVSDFAKVRQNSVTHSEISTEEIQNSHSDLEKLIREHMKEME